MDIRRLLVPIDFSRDSLKALRFAAEVGKRFKTEIYLLHVFDVSHPFFSYPLLPADMADDAELLESAKELVMEKLEEVGRGYWDSIVGVVRKGQPHRQIVEFAQEVEADLVILGERGLTSFRAARLGSTAERVVRFCRRPVLIWRGRQNEASIKRIILPIDSAGRSRQLVEYSLLFANAFKSKLDLLHVVEDVTPQEKLYTKDQENGFNSILREEARETIQRILSKVEGNGGAGLAPKIVSGCPYEEIVNLAKKDKVDLVILGAHDHEGQDRFMVGKTAEHVVRYAPCTVLTFRSKHCP